MKELVGGLARSKKFAGLVLGLVTSIAARVGLPPELAEPASELVVALVCCYLVSQGVADHGKERAKIEAAGKAER